MKVSFLNLYYLTLGSVDEERIDIGEFIQGRWRSEVTQMRSIARPVSGYKSSELAREFSNYIKRYVNSEDAVTWQESKIY